MHLSTHSHTLRHEHELKIAVATEYSWTVWNLQISESLSPWMSTAQYQEKQYFLEVLAQVPDSDAIMMPEYPCILVGSRDYIGTLRINTKWVPVWPHYNADIFFLVIWKKAEPFRSGRHWGVEISPKLFGPPYLDHFFSQNYTGRPKMPVKTQISI